jgi:riboflavin kinase/FMN adenylyltransferase
MSKRIYALGFFDGVHRGHQALLGACRHLAAENGCGTAAITFEKHPKSLFTDCPPPLINTVQDRQLLLRRFGVDQVDILPVKPEVMSTNWEIFLRKLVAQGAVGFVCGDDFRFGDRGAGNAGKLMEFCAGENLPCVIIPEQTVDGVRVSSTRIRNFLEEGEMERATALLGHPHILTGEVVSGYSLGRKLGTPTANLRLPSGILCPRHGVYACRTWVDGKSFCAVTNVGTRPTVGGSHVTVEPWLLDFSGDLYGKQITLEFHQFLRPEQKFESLDALRSEIRRNALQTRKYFEKK